MKTVIAFESWIHVKELTSAVKIFNLILEGIETEKKIVFSYNNGNAYERFAIEQYDGSKLNKLLGSMADLGVEADTSAYHLMSEDDQKARFEMLTEKGYEFVKALH